MEDAATLRLGIFLGLFALLAAAEALLPRRDRRMGRGRRWATNWGLVLIDTLTLRLVAIAVPLLAVGAALDAAARGWGLFNRIDWPVALEVLLSVLILDFLIWLQHVVTHKVPLLWRLHQVHHADPDFDVTTAIRFHPVEIALSMGLKIGAVYLLGPAALAVILFEILLNGMAMFNHANLALPRWLDRWLRLVVVTPDMHRVHHSVDRDEHDTNYGFSLSIWDRLFGTYRPQPRDGHEGMRIGLDIAQSHPEQLGWSLARPFRKQ
ncbi:sterol desaturase family protein [Oceanomicrobium pacificus]|uniref:Sterol desaturase family protein n=1 Tax=Oceanomicrobium pacificus TaxID=2692916 RepID=A0A6B0TP80_9RHOB|nr:sterol desaturase family protein [Oceanomicrobium pacificus]MXU66420.1 sterol desaturase family protein [Oceanomicrobium pacificus]